MQINHRIYPQIEHLKKHTVGIFTIKLIKNYSQKISDFNTLDIV
jgi:hypothetical protein